MIPFPPNIQSRSPQKMATATSSIDVPSITGSTLVEILRERAARQGQDNIYTFLYGDEQRSLDYQQLDALARSRAAAILDHCRPGDRALLIYPPSLDYVVALYACMYAGVIAVPAYAPRPNRPMSRLESIISSAEPSLVLTTREMLTAPKGVFRQQDGPLSKLPNLATDDVPADYALDCATPPISAETPVILQYTSGSTAVPKGVILTHGNIVHNTGAIQRNFPLDSSSSTVFWLPPFHDMGLIGG